MCTGICYYNFQESAVEETLFEGDYQKHQSRLSF